MTKTDYCVSAEEVMALLDGELAAADARGVMEHVKQCGECARVMEQMRGTAELLSQWSVPAVSRAVEERVLERAAEADSRRAKASGKRFWLKLAVAGGGAVALAAFVMMIGFPGGHVSKRSLTYTKPQQSAETANGAVSGDGQALYEQMGRAQQGIPPNGQVLYEQMGQAKQEDRFSSGGLQAVENGAALKDKARTRAIAGVAGMGSDSLAASQFAASPSPMIARTVFLTVMVKDVEAARRSLDSILARHHGYSAQLNVSSPENGARNLRASLRIPEPDLASAAGEIKALGRVVNESQSGEEVSQQHADLVARLKTARETETRFQMILVQRTGKLSDVLEVEQNIARIRGEIEAMEAEQKELEHRVDFASVDVQVVEEYKAKLDSPAATSVSTRMHNSFIAGYHHATETLVGIVLFAEEYGPPLLIWVTILGVPAVVAWRRYKRVRTGR